MITQAGLKRRSPAMPENLQKRGSGGAPVISHILQFSRHIKRLCKNIDKYSIKHLKKAQYLVYTNRRVQRYEFLVGKDGLNQMSYQVREMKPEDWADVSRIYEQGIHSNLSTLLTVCPDYDEWDKSHLKACRLVVTEDGEVIGWAALLRLSDKPAYSGVAEISIYIDMTHQHRGAGRALLEALVTLSEKRGIWSLQAVILRENHPSIRLHEACGFRVIGYRERLGRDRFGVWRDVILMERRSVRDDF